MAQTELLGIKSNQIGLVNTSEKRVIAFRLGNELVGIDIKKVIKITNHLEITPVPKTPDYILGVMNLRGNIVPVVDLKRKLGLAQTRESEDLSVLVVDTVFGEVGLSVDRIEGAVKIDINDLQPPPMNAIGIDVGNMQGVVMVEGPQGRGDLLVLLDIAKIFSMHSR